MFASFLCLDVVPPHRFGNYRLFRGSDGRLLLDFIYVYLVLKFLFCGSSQNVLLDIFPRPHYYAVPGIHTPPVNTVSRRPTPYTQAIRAMECTAKPAPGSACAARGTDASTQTRRRRTRKCWHTYNYMTIADRDRSIGGSDVEICVTLYLQVACDACYDVGSTFGLYIIF